VLYSRLLALGRGGRVSLSLADVVAERLSRFEEAFVAVEGQGAREIQQALGMVQHDAAVDDVDDEDSSDEEAGDEGELANGLDEEEGGDEAGNDDVDDDFDDDDLDDEDEAR